MAARSTLDGKDSSAFARNLLALTGFVLFAYFHSSFMEYANADAALLFSYYGSTCCAYALLCLKPVAAAAVGLVRSPLALCGVYALYLLRALLAFDLPPAVSVAVMTATGMAWAVLNYAWLELVFSRALPRDGRYDYVFVSSFCALCALWAMAIASTSQPLNGVASVSSCVAAGAIHVFLLRSASFSNAKAASVVVGESATFPTIKRHAGMLAIILIFGILYGIRQYNSELSLMLAADTSESSLGNLVGSVLLGLLAYSQAGSERFSRVFDFVPLVSAAALLAFAFNLLGTEVGQFLFAFSHILFFTFAYVFIIRAARASGSEVGAARSIGLCMLVYQSGIALGVVLFGLILQDSGYLYPLVFFVILAMMLGTSLIPRLRTAPEVPNGGEGLRPSGDAEAACRAMVEQYALSKREAEVLAYLVKGVTQKAISEELVLAPSTVKSHAKHLYEKMDVHSKDQLIYLYESYLHGCAGFGTSR